MSMLTPFIDRFVPRRVSDLDYWLAREWRATLRRSQTLAERSYQCFRWTPALTECAP